MDQQIMRGYIANLPTGSLSSGLGYIQPEAGAEGALGPGPELGNLPQGVVVGSNLISFDPAITAPVRSSVALSLLAAQRVAANDTVLQSADQWLDRHMTVLQNLLWSVESRNTVENKFDSLDVSVHKAIIPFLAAAFGPGAAVGALILAALNGLQSMQEKEPWITLFSRESRRFNVSEFHFTAAQATPQGVRLNLAAARFDASYGYTQVLFFKVRNSSASFVLNTADMAAGSAELISVGEPLRAKLGAQARAYVDALPDDLLRPR